MSPKRILKQYYYRKASLISSSITDLEGKWVIDGGSAGRIDMGWWRDNNFVIIVEGGNAYLQQYDRS